MRRDPLKTGGLADDVEGFARAIAVVEFAPVGLA